MCKQQFCSWALYKACERLGLSLEPFLQFVIKTLFEDSQALSTRIQMLPTGHVFRCFWRYLLGYCAPDRPSRLALQDLGPGLTAPRLLLVGARVQPLMTQLFPLLVQLADMRHRLAIQFANCFAAESGKPTFPCPDGKSIKDCTAPMNDLAHSSYRSFFIHVDAVCHHLQ